MNKTTKYKNGFTIAYSDFGDRDGFPILIQHGLIASIKDHLLFSRLIEIGARVILVARPGYGESMPYELNNVGEWGEIVAVLVDELKLEHFDVLGISSGAPYTYAIAYKLPDRVRNLYILSGIPALYDENIQSVWPYPLNNNSSIAEMQDLAKQLWFSNLAREDLEKDDIQDSLKNNCFGIALDLIIRSLDWGFRLSTVKTKVFMRHSRADTPESFISAEMTSKLLPNCQFEVRENDAHFSQQVLDDFIETTISQYYLK